MEIGMGMLQVLPMVLVSDYTGEGWWRLPDRNMSYDAVAYAIRTSLHFGIV